MTVVLLLGPSRGQARKGKQFTRGAIQRDTELVYSLHGRVVRGAGCDGGEGIPGHSRAFGELGVCQPAARFLFVSRDRIAQFYFYQDSTATVQLNGPLLLRSNFVLTVQRRSPIANL